MRVQILRAGSTAGGKYDAMQRLRRTLMIGAVAAANTRPEVALPAPPVLPVCMTWVLLQRDP
jgi:hypothetical protein